MCRGDHWSPADLTQQRFFRGSYFTDKRARASNARPYKSFFDSLTCCNNNRLFLVLGTAVQSQQNQRFIVGLYCPVVVLRRKVPRRISSGTLKKRIAMYFCNALFGLMLFWFQNHFPLSGKMILLTKKKITIDTPPFKTVVPML